MVRAVADVVESKFGGTYSSGSRRPPHVHAGVSLALIDLFDTHKLGFAEVVATIESAAGERHLTYLAVVGAHLAHSVAGLLGQHHCKRHTHTHKHARAGQDALLAPALEVRRLQ